MTSISLVIFGALMVGVVRVNSASLQNSGRNTVRVEKRSVDPYCTYHAAPHITYLEMASSMLTYWNTHYVDLAMCLTGDEPVSYTQKFYCEDLRYLAANTTERLQKYRCMLYSFFQQSSEEFLELNSLVHSIIGFLEPNGARECNPSVHNIRGLSVERIYSQNLISLQVEIACLQQYCGDGSGAAIEIPVFHHCQDPNQPYSGPEYCSNKTPAWGDDIRETYELLEILNTNYMRTTMCSAGGRPITTNQKFICEDLLYIPESITERLENYRCVLSSFFRQSNEDFTQLNNTMYRIADVMEFGSAKECNPSVYNVTGLSSQQIYTQYLTNSRVEIGCLQRACGYRTGTAVELPIFHRCL
ncbi:hypothetical protein EB796_016963 [Bugula neritina]|uniref:Uncharacterized protein n=1 Tax=Bugula neritina TaxID=10212 RepID=A0A7J7JEK8_BUGNE|nr:hypothetical protein EB796_016963 [Bugula neritina]